jgi:hypothetical protein
MELNFCNPRIHYEERFHAGLSKTMDILVVIFEFEAAIEDLIRKHS